MSTLFTAIQDGVAILRNKGVWRQAPLFEHRGWVYAKWGPGFIRLCDRNATSLPHVCWDHVEMNDPHHFDGHGRMRVSNKDK